MKRGVVVLLILNEVRGIIMAGPILWGLLKAWGVIHG
jgi:hypothetical protein